MNDLFLRACRGEPVERTPVWIMRQAGRYLPEYMKVREKYSFWEICTIPEVTSEVTLQPLRRLGVDAAILFSDILVPLAAMGLDIDFHPAPEIGNPIRHASDIDRLHLPEPEGLLARVADGVRLIRQELESSVPLIGFGGAPFTLATYAVCGGGSKNHAEIRSMLFGDREAAHRLLRKITDGLVLSLTSQIEAGAQAVQLFDSWAGLLGPEDYAEFALPYARDVLARIAGSGVPRIYFAPGASSLLGSAAGVGAEVIGVDWRISLAEARRVLGDRFAVQGNMDPGVLLGSPAAIEQRVVRILGEAAGAKGHVMNLGHGILPETPVENAIAFVDAVRRHSQREAGSGK
jgi:uroporphyrinogen decarboxylase